MAETLLIPSATNGSHQTMQLREAIEQAVDPSDLLKARAALMALEQQLDECLGVVRARIAVLEQDLPEKMRPDTNRPRTMPEMARAFDAIGRPVDEGKNAPLSIDPDDYPVY